MDFVVTWVDDKDPEWRDQFYRYKNEKDPGSHDARFRSWDNLHYWFRGVEKFAPWVDKVHLVTWGHVPEWLKTNHPKLNIVKHWDFIPEEYLPTFNSRTIELNFHRIKELSEEFIIFNDDVFLIDSVKPEMFFVDGKPCDMPIILPFGASEYTKAMLNNLILVNRNFDIKEQIKKKWKNWFNIKYGKYNFSNLILLSFMKSHHISPMNFHIAVPSRKSTYETLWRDEFEALHYSSKQKFRKADTVNIALPRYWDLISGNFYPLNRIKLGSSLSTTDDNVEQIVAFISNQSKPILCVNDHKNLRDFDNAKTKINKAFEELFPNKSEYER